MTSHKIPYQINITVPRNQILATGNDVIASTAASASAVRTCCPPANTVAAKSDEILGRVLRQWFEIVGHAFVMLIILVGKLGNEPGKSHLKQRIHCYIYLYVVLVYLTY